MKKKLITFAMTAVLACIGTTGSAQVIFNTDFGSSADGATNTVSGWESQPVWAISGGNIQFTGNSFGRARNFGTFAPNVGDTVRVILTDLVRTGDGGEIYRFGIANDAEHTGANTPMVGTEATWSGSNFVIGGATDTAYNSGDLLTIQMDFTRLATGSGWNLTTTINNTTDGSNFASGTALTSFNTDGQTGAGLGLTASEYIDAAGSLRYGMRGFGGGAGNDTLDIGGISLEVIAVPEPSTFALLGLGVLSLALLRRRK
ncbi:MAG: PEP-CTERM sorting domain-containing protein [Verrucomicrobiota bacterium]